MEIKICGITNPDDAINACNHGADALGFIFYKKSPRYVTPETAKIIIEHLPRDTAIVGVFVNHDIQALREIYEFCGLDLIQLHGDESREYCRQFPNSTLIKSFSPRGEEDLNSIKSYPVRAVLMDARDSGLYGGTGKKCNWELAAMAKDKFSLILSGGLNSNNILDAIKTVSPHAVDVNSGVEVTPGKKDPEKVKSIIEVVHTIKSKSPVTIFTKSV
ncbi:MAG TPA: phosphoribosylanthranilate isomerase [Syntrophaceae bacterium]|jgi:phosphoribosylanthranilate isomerase|nr:phosphoribosylanthranilate isomerase [Syntrophaceae bacterium]